MAEVDVLDDFFAKKDKSNKKKGKSKSKIVVSDLLPASTPTPPNEPNDNVDRLSEQIAETKLDNTSAGNESSKEKKKPKKKRDKEGAETSSRKEDDEWNEVQDTIDYSGLRIATKNIAKEAAEEAAENAARSEPEYDDDGKLIEKTKDETVWKKVSADAPEIQRPDPPAQTPVILEMPNVSDSKYVPPSRRGGASSGDLAPINIKKPHRKKVAPNMHSQEDFPSLGSAPAPVDYDVSKFERVKGGGSNSMPNQKSGPSRLETSNMYSALERR